MRIVGRPVHRVLDVQEQAGVVRCHGKARNFGFVRAHKEATQIGLVAGVDQERVSAPEARRQGTQREAVRGGGEVAPEPSATERLPTGGKRQAFAARTASSFESI
mgnify:CR=1 FL=1